MIKRIASWFADHSVEIVGMAIGVGGFGALANGFADLGSVWCDHARAMGALSLACLLAGIAIGDSRGMSRCLRRRHDERVVAERAEEVTRELLRDISDLVCPTEAWDRVWRIRLTDYGRYAVSVSGDILDEAVRP